jgi:preprotein translocase subunit SecG
MLATILIVIHLMIVLALIVVVLLQRSEGGALGIGGGGGGLMTARGAANALTRTTAFLAAGFFVTSLALGITARYGSRPADVLDRIQPNQTAPAGGDSGNLLDQLGGMPAPSDGGVPAGGETTTPAGTPTTADPAIAPSSATIAPPLGDPPVQTPSPGVPAGGEAPVPTPPASPAAPPASPAAPAGSSAPTPAQ